MTFDDFINKPASESDLLKQLVWHIQSQYSSYQNSCFFIKLDKVTEQTSQIIWIKSFADAYELGDFYFDTINQRACILIKFEKGYYELFIQGFQICDRFKILTDKTEGSRPMKLSGQIEEHEIIPRDLFESGFGEITRELSFTKRNKAV